MDLIYGPVQQPILDSQKTGYWQEGFNSGRTNRHGTGSVRSEEVYELSKPDPDVNDKEQKAPLDCRP
jgi:hypothetical protein